MSMKKVYLKAISIENLGDDIFIKMITDRYPDVQWYMLTDKKGGQIAKNIDNLHIIRAEGFRHQCVRGSQKLKDVICKHISKVTGKAKKRYLSDSYYIKKTDICVRIAGSVYMEPDNFDVENYFDREIPFYAGKPYIIGCNFGPYRTKEFLDIHKLLFEKATQVCFRDKKSVSYFAGMENIEYAPDIIFGYDKEKIIEPKIDDYVIISLANINKDEICVDNSAYDIVYKEFVKKIVRYYTSLGKKIVFLGFCKSQGDKIIADDIIEDQDNIINVSYPDIGIEECVGYISKASIIYATRYHAMILGWLFEKKVVPICYNEKMKNVIEDLENVINSSIYNIELKDIEGQKFEEIIRKCEQSTLIDGEIIKRLSKESENHFRKIDEALES